MSDALRLSQLSRLVGMQGLTGDGEVRVCGVQSDSRRVVAGDLFAAVPGAQHDGARFVPDAIARGAVAVLSESAIDCDVPVLRCDDVRRRLGAVAHHVYGDPSRQLRVVGVTGTNGKTTVSHLLERVLEDVWGPVALCGTIAMRGVGSQVAAELTTPEADSLARFACDERRAGAKALLMEVSSIALVQGRLEGMHFEAVGFTNLSQDHLDFHGTMEAYGEAKATLFDADKAAHRVVCIDDDFGRALGARAAEPCIRCATSDHPDAELRVLEWRSSRDGLRATLGTPEGELTLESPLFGRHNLQNLMVTLGLCRALGVDLQVAARSLANAYGAPGRMERVEGSEDVGVFVDYAHTPDAVARAIEAVRTITEGRLFVVVGCGGDRDATKRAPMGAAAARGADIAVLTSDNPRTEDPEAILAAVEAGARDAAVPSLSMDALAEASSGYAVECDRARAIAAVLGAARAGDCVLIAGKGHETYQIIGRDKRPFDDREVARRVLLGLREGGKG